MIGQIFTDMSRTLASIVDFFAVSDPDLKVRIGNESFRIHKTARAQVTMQQVRLHAG